MIYVIDEHILKDYYGEFYIASIHHVLFLNRSDNVLALIHDREGNYYLQDVYIDISKAYVQFGDVEKVNKNNTKAIAEKYHVVDEKYHASGFKVTDKPIINAIKAYEDKLEEQANIIPSNLDGKYVKPYKIDCRYFKYFGIEQGNKLIYSLEEKYNFSDGIISLFWQLRDQGYCETYAIDRLHYVMYVLDAEYIPYS